MLYWSKQWEKGRNRLLQLLVSRIQCVCWAILEKCTIQIGLGKATCIRVFEKYNGPDVKCMLIFFQR